MPIRQATEADVSRIAEIIVFNNRVNFFPIFRDEGYSFGEMQVVPLAGEYLADRERLSHTWVYDDGVVKGLVTAMDGEVKKMYVDPAFQRQGIGDALLTYALREHHCTFVWTLEVNAGAIRFYRRHGFRLTGDKALEPVTDKSIVKLER